MNERHVECGRRPCVEVTDCCLLNLALLGLVGFALMVPLPSNPSEERNSPRWRRGRLFAFTLPLARLLDAKTFSTDEAKHASCFFS